ncbi:MAG: Lpg1974 family pore-forming outer membrane protein [Legionella sp.]|uniref:Lpg1974 family pore-forming outer membrane protein n=1 Tax=Legionella sp. TaxID=459 RepID=UPI002851A02A|nr:Lpg1974 family pore-forming outer membrane protein [Legionella sp.]
MYTLFKKTIFSAVLLSTSAVYANQQDTQRIDVSGAWLYLKPMSNNHTYAYYVAGQQPFYQSWHAQSINPSYASSFELGVVYHIKESTFTGSVDWIHLASNDSASKQGNQTTDFTHVAFVGPPFDMGPQVFGIRQADAKLKYNYDNVAINLEKVFSLSDGWLSAKVMAGVNILYLQQDMSTTFSDFVGATTPLTSPLSADPNFLFNVHSTSTFTGAGPDLGLNSQLALFNGLSIVGAAFGSLNVGTVSIQEKFSATSTPLRQNGIGLSQQQITTPNKTQVVPGFDGKLGLMYRIKTQQLPNFSVEGGYRVIAYMNAISTTTPQTLVQTGTTPGLPDISTGTMGIISASQQDRPFNLNGPYVALKLSVM